MEIEFAEFETITKARVSINPALVWSIRETGHTPAACELNDAVIVRGTRAEIIAKLKETVPFS